MSTSTLQLMPSTNTGNTTDLSQLDPATLASIPGITYDLKRLKVYSSCLRCRAKKVKCDRKEPCSRCVKHSVECSYRELASVQLDIRQFQRHLNNPKVRKDGAGIITSTATPILTLPSGDTAVLSAGSTTNSDGAAAAAVAAATLMAAAAKASSASAVTSASVPSTPTSESVNPLTVAIPRKSVKSHNHSPPLASTSSFSRPKQTKSAESTDTESDVPTVPAASSSRSIAMARARVQKMYRKKQVVRQTPFTPPSARPCTFLSSVADDNNEEEEECEEDDEPIERLVLRDPVDQSFHPTSYSFYGLPAPASHPSSPDITMRSEFDDEDYDSSNGSSLKKKKRVFNNQSSSNSSNDIPIWRAQAVGKHKQTVHEQDLAETFGLAVYLKAKEMSVPEEDSEQDHSNRRDHHSMAGQTIDYEYDHELEQALVRRMPTFFSRPDRSYSRAGKYAQAGYNPTLPFARPSQCQLAAGAAAAVTAPVAAQCCCQIAAKQGQAPGTCYYSGASSHDHGHGDLSAPSSMSPPPSSPSHRGDNNRIAYSPSYQPVSKEDGQQHQKHRKQEYSSMMPPPPMSFKNTSPCSSPRVELAPIYLPKPFNSNSNNKPASTSDLSAFQVGGGSRSSGSNSPAVQRDSSSEDQLPPLNIACKYNEPNVDAWDMIEKPISRTVPVTTKRGRSIKMEMGWILS